MASRGLRALKCPRSGLLSEKLITVDKTEYERLQDAGLLLGALKTAGIEKWESWPIAAALFAKTKGEVVDE